MPSVYGDQNFLITAHDGPADYRIHLRELATNGTVSFVCSPWHWVEMAEDADFARSTSVADFVDALNPTWMFDRRTIQKLEASAALFRFIPLQVELPKMIGNIRDVINDLGGRAEHRDTREFVAHLRTIGENHPLELSLRNGLTTTQKNTAYYRAGKLTPQLQKRVERLYIERLLPDATPAGVVINGDTRNRFLDTYRLSDLPTVALEHYITRDNWASGRQLKQNTFLDQQHIMALPYVDLFITDDQRLAGLMKKAAQNFPFKTAEILGKAQFDARYP